MKAFRALRVFTAPLRASPTLVSLLAALFVIGLLPDRAEAAGRLGGARSLGVQSPVASSSQKAAQAAPPAAQSAVQPQTASAPETGSGRWLGLLAGLAAGLGMGWLVSQGGLGGLVIAAIMGLLVLIVVFGLLRLLLRPRRETEQWEAMEPVAAEPVLLPLPEPSEPIRPQAARPVRLPPPEPGEPVRARAAVPAAPIPADFDSAAFIRQAKLNFIRLQEANDRGNLAALREVTTEKMFDAILADLHPSHPRQHTDVVKLDASLLEVATEGDRHSASVRFHGTIREGGGQPASFEEVWHLQKPVSGSTGWVLAGIQQVS